MRHDLPTIHGRGIDRLPGDVIAPFKGSLVRGMNIAELSRAFPGGS